MSEPSKAAMLKCGCVRCRPMPHPYRINGFPCIAEEFDAFAAERVAEKDAEIARLRKDRDRWKARAERARQEIADALPGASGIDSLSDAVHALLHVHSRQAEIIRSERKRAETAESDLAAATAPESEPREEADS